MGDHGKACVPELEERNCNIVLVSMWPCLGALRDAFVLPPYLVPQVSQHHPIRSQVDLVYHEQLDGEDKALRVLPAQFATQAARCDSQTVLNQKELVEAGSLDAIRSPKS